MGVVEAPGSAPVINSPPAPAAASVAAAEPVPAPAPVPVPSGPRVYSKARFAWIQAEPRHAKGWLGYLGLGSSVALRGNAEKARVPHGGAACEAWYAVAPFGYVCAGDTATLDPKDPVVAALAEDGPKLDSPWPYQYGESLGAPRYKKIPTPEEQRKAEWDLRQHLEHVAGARSGGAIDKSLIDVDLSPAGVGAPDLVAVSPF